MVKALSVCCVIAVVGIFAAAIACGFAGIGIKTATGTKAAALEEMFGVELMQITLADGTKIPVIRTAEGDYLNAYEFINAFHGKEKTVTAYTVDNGKATAEKSVVITFNVIKDPANIKNILGQKPSHTA